MVRKTTPENGVHLPERLMVPLPGGAYNTMHMKFKKVYQSPKPREIPPSVYSGTPNQ